jgi:hypothetical protein
MTDRIRHLTVVLDRDIREDDLETLTSAIQMLRGVSQVKTHVVSATDAIARMAVRSEIQGKLFKAIDDIFDPPPERPSMTLRIEESKDIDDYDDDAERSIVAVAVLDTQTGIVYSMEKPARHHTVIHAMATKLGLSQVSTHEQGFLTSDGFFLRRKSACIVAEKANQIIRKTNPMDTLFSEDLW